ncbi:hypothetical protein NDU88_001110 [Pleurodeles waltl]|uniref:Uncharacterized protein n=1 Tax=Pleurodeles waltl TaxID=8319 RepID=A0AAV7VZH9_PLEWA|nr:hypothetical protein NDU88_001110 [Pleurodeles waltl]
MLELPYLYTANARDTLAAMLMQPCLSAAYAIKSRALALILVRASAILKSWSHRSMDKAAASMSQPSQFLSEKGDPALPWKTIEKLFDSYLLAIEGEKFSAVRKEPVLLHNLGIEGKKAYESLD